LLGVARVRRTNYSYGGKGFSRSTHGEDVPVLRPEEIRGLPPRQALVVAENAPPLIAGLSRCVDGKPGQALLAAQAAARDRVAAARRGTDSLTDRTARAHDAAARAGLRPVGPPRAPTGQGPR